MECAVDRISGLPEGILHHILSFLSTEEAIQIVATCKRLNQVWTTLPVLGLGPNFFPILSDDEDEDEDEDEEEEEMEEIMGLDENNDNDEVDGLGQGTEEGMGLEQEAEEFLGHEEKGEKAEEGLGRGEEVVMDKTEDHEKGSGVGIEIQTETSDSQEDKADESIQIRSRREKLFNFIDQTVTRHTMHDLNIQKFQLGETKLDIELRQHLGRWIHNLVEGNIKELALIIEDRVWFDLPRILLSAASLCALTLRDCRMPSGAISLSSLRKLCLVSVWIDDRFLTDILSTCRELEDLKLDWCRGLQNSIKISGQSQRMRALNLRLSNQEPIDNVVVEAQYLERFTWAGARLPVKLDIITNYEGSLKFISLFGANITNKWLCDLLSKLPRLEELMLGQLNLNSIEISSSSLKRLQLIRVFESTEKKYGEFTINTPNLVYFKYYGSLLSVFLTSVAAKYVFLGIEEAERFRTPEYFSGSLTHFIRSFGDAETVTFYGLFFEHLIVSEETRLNMDAPLAHVKHLILEGMSKTSPDYVARALVENLLWCCPCLDKLSFRPDVYFHPAFHQINVSIKVAARSAVGNDVITLSRQVSCHLNCDSISPLSRCLCLTELEFEGPDAEIFRCLMNKSNHLSFSHMYDELANNSPPTEPPL